MGVPVAETGDEAMRPAHSLVLVLLADYFVVVRKYLTKRK